MIKNVILKLIKKIFVGILFLLTILLLYWLFLEIRSRNITIKRTLPENFSESVVVKYPEYGFFFYKSELRDFSWAPDSRRMVGHIFPHYRDDVVEAASDLREPLSPSEIYIWDIENNHYSRISAGTLLDEKRHPLWNPTNETIMYSCRGCFDGEGLGVVNLTTNESSGIKNSSAGYWFPDGERLLTNNFEIIDLESNVLDSFQIVIEDSTRIRLESLSPNGEYLVLYNYFQNTFGEGEGTLYLYIMNSQEIKSIWDDGVHDIGWSGDSEWIILHDVNVTSGNKPGLFAINQQTLCVTDVFNFPKNLDNTARIGYKNFGWSPDGETFAISGVLEGVASGIFLIDTDSDLIQDWLSSGTCGN